MKRNEPRDRGERNRKGSREGDPPRRALRGYERLPDDEERMPPRRPDERWEPADPSRWGEMGLRKSLAPEHYDDRRARDFYDGEPAFGEGDELEESPPVHPRRRPARGPHFGRGPRGWSRSDQRILEDVGQALWEDGDLDATDVELSVEGGVVTLKGVVERRRDKRRAEDLALDVPGVRDVFNLIRVSGGAESNS